MGRLGYQCKYPQCPNIVDKPGTYCDKHKEHKRTWKDKREAEGGRNPFYDTAAWRRCSDAYLKANPKCEICCKRLAVEVNHKVPVSEAPELALVWSNLEAVCKECHYKEGGKQSWNKRRAQKATDKPAVTKLKPFSADVKIIYGPPGAGKSSYVEAHARMGALIVDFDRILESITNIDRFNIKAGALLPYAEVARQAIINRLRKRSDVKDVWLIHSKLSLKQRQAYAQAGAKVMLLCPPIDITLKQLQSQRGMNGVQLQKQVVEDWYSSHVGGNGEVNLWVA